MRIRPSAWNHYVTKTNADRDILGIGNAIVDVVAQTDDTFLSRHDMRKGLDDADRR